MDMTRSFFGIFIALVVISRSWGAAPPQLSPAELRAHLSPTYSDRFLLFAQHVRMAQVRNSLEENPSRLQQHEPSAAVGDILTLSQTEVRDAVLRSLTQLGDSSVRGAGALSENATLSELCLNHSMAFLAGLATREPWAVQMLDAMGKPKPAITELNLNWPGAYHQCLRVRANTSVISHPQFSGQYCTASAISPVGPSAGLGMLPAGVLMGLCVPDTCSETDVIIFVQEVLNLLNVTALIPGPVTIAYKDTTIDARASVAAVICSIFAILVIMGTAMDILLVQRPKWVLESKNSDSFINENLFDSLKSENQPLLQKAPDVTVAAPELGLLSKSLIAFSVWTNGQKLLSTAQVEGSLTCVHGVRFLSMTWVVLGHIFTFTSGSAENTATYIQELTKRWTFQAIANATVSVDSFFLLSGLLVAFLTLKEMKKNNGKLNWFMFYFHRFWRLTPVYMMCIMIYVCFMRYWGEGPFWPRTIADRENCEKNWWTNFLYINNFIQMKDGCFTHTWYMANDMQFYILSPLIFVPLYFFPFVGAVVSFIFLLVTSLTPALIVLHFNLPPGLFVQIKDRDMTNLIDYMDYLYVKPYNRMGPYIVGMLAGYFLFRTNCKLRINKYLNLFIWAIATACALAVLYGLYDSTNGQGVTLAVSAFYNAVSRQVWGACVAWVIVACVTGNGGFVNTLLSWSALTPLSRLTYCIYLIHIMLIDTYIYNLQDLFYLNDLNVVALFLAALVVSYMAAFVISLVFESPMMGLEKVMRSAVSSRRHKH